MKRDGEGREYGTFPPYRPTLATCGVRTTNILEPLPPSQVKMRKLHTADVIAIDAVQFSAIASGAWTEPLRRPKLIRVNWLVH